MIKVLFQNVDIIFRPNLNSIGEKVCSQKNYRAQTSQNLIITIYILLIAPWLSSPKIMTPTNLPKTRVAKMLMQNQQLALLRFRKIKHLQNSDLIFPFQNAEPITGSAFFCYEGHRTNKDRS